MDPDPSSRRKLKFTPKAPRRRKPAPPPVKEANDDHDDIQLLRRFARQTRRGPEVEKKPAEEILCSHGVASTDGRSERANSSRNKEIKYEQMQPRTTTVSTAGTGTGAGEGSGNSTIAVIEKKKKEYKEPWDYSNSYYPITLPLRRPYSGNPDLLDKEEFEEAPKHNEDDDLPAAIELGLVDEDDKPQLLLFKFPSKLPFGRPARRDATDDQSKASKNSLMNQKGKGIAGLDSSVSGTKGNEVLLGGKKTCSLEELPEGHLGKMLVYKSGAVKLKFGDVLFDVSGGIECNCPQSAMAINTRSGDCFDLGEMTKKAIVIPDLDHLRASD